MPSTKAIHIDVIVEDTSWSKARLGVKTFFPAVLEAAFKSLPVKPKSPLDVSITLTNDKTIKILNRDHRGKNKPTNVLSFPLWESIGDIPSGSEAVPLGDIIIAYETMAKEATEQNKKLKDHMAHMLVHGFLHLLGYDHMNDQEAEKMEKLEVKILKKLDIKDPYTI
jgi:probable rRNA maturation factor